MGWPTTAFEDDVAAGASQYTYSTLAEELTYLQALDAQSPMFAWSQVGTSELGAPMRRAVVSYPTPDLAGKDIVLMLGAQHGSEPSGREACYRFMRELCQKTDPADLAYLSTVAWVFLPTCNPDSLTTWSVADRLNAIGVDLNRDHVACKAAETRVMQQQIRDLDPVIILDHHESGFGEPDLQYGTTENTMTYAALRTHAATIATLAASDAAAAGYTTAQYGTSNVALGALRNVGTFHHAVSVLFEATRAQTTNSIRVKACNVHMIAVRRAYSYHKANKTTIANDCAASRAAQSLKGFSRYTYNFHNGTTVPNMPIGYRLTADQMTALGQAPAIHEIRAYDNGAEKIVSMGQTIGQLIPQLVDARAVDTAVIAATTVSSLPLPPVRKAGSTVTVTSYRKAGGTKTLTTFRNSPRI